LFNKYLILFIVIPCFLLAFHASANEKPITHEEKAVFSYMKLTNQSPQYDDWIMNSEIYNATPNYLKKKLVKTGVQRLKNGFNAYDHKKELINVKRPIRLKTTVNSDDQQILNIQFIKNGFNETPYFPFPYGKESIALIATELERFKTITLEADQVPTITKYFYDSAPYEASMEVVLRPLSADSKEPLFVDYKERWLMLGDIANVRIAYFDDYKLEDITIWEYTAPWYAAKILAETIDKQKTEQESE